MTLIGEFFKEDVIINPDVVKEYTSITLKTVNSFNHKIETFIMPHKQIKRTSKVYIKWKTQLNEAIIAGNIKKITEIKDKLKEMAR